MAEESVDGRGGGGGALLSAFLQAVSNRLVSRDIGDYFRGRRLNENLLRKLNAALLSINEVIDDAEEKEITSPEVEAWVNDVKDAFFDAEDLLDEIDTEVSKNKHEAGGQTSGSKVWSFFTSFVNLFDKEIESRMKKVLDRLESLASQKNSLGLKEASRVGAGLRGRRESESLVDEAAVYGRQDDKEMLINWLLSENENGTVLSVISAVGMGGLGKTTLAQLVYNDQRVKDEFDLKAWVLVSEEFDVLRMAKTIFEAITLSTNDTKDINILQLKLKERLTGKKFLLVLDDVWNENDTLWEAFQTPFTVGAHGSKILVTTRSEKVASTCSAKVHQLKPLPEEDSYLLFAKHAFHDGVPHSNPDLEEIGRKIVDKCKGLPLTLKTIGSLLNTKLNFEEWNSILMSEIWDLSAGENNILPSLRLSYHYLSSPLKRCFAYCSLFPKDYEFEKMHLVQLWNAENFLHDHQKNKTSKEIGEEYFHDLLSRSFFQRSSGNKTCFIMHDLVSDLARHVSREFSLRLEVEEAETVSKRTRHFSCLSNYCESSRRFEIMCKADKVRTFLPLTMYQYHGPSRPIQYIPRMVVENLLPKCKSLRVLSLLGYSNIIELPNSLGNLKHLRYLDLSYTSIKTLPDSTCLLFNLQTLKLRHCDCLEELPSDLHKLVNLRHLDFYGTKLGNKPKELGKLKNLQVLTSFYVGKCSKMDMKQLGELNLEGTLSILELQNVVQPADVLAANLKNKIHLEELSLEWSIKNDESRKERDVLENLQPHQNIKKLCIRYYGGTRFPNWLTDNSLSNLVSLELRSCKYCFLLPPLGILPSLKTLKVKELEGIIVIGPEFYGNGSCTIPFGSLEILKFVNIVNWEEWECQTVSGAFPRLQELHIKNCPMLREHLPENLASFRKLVIHNCQKLVASLPWASKPKFLEGGESSSDRASNDEIENTMVGESSSDGASNKKIGNTMAGECSSDGASNEEIENTKAGECSLDGASNEVENAVAGECSKDRGAANEEVDNKMSGEYSMDGGAANEGTENSMSGESSVDGGAADEVENARSGECTKDGGAPNEEIENTMSSESSMDGGAADEETENAMSGECSKDRGAADEENENSMSSECSMDGGAAVEEVEYTRSGECSMDRGAGNEEVENTRSGECSMDRGADNEEVENTRSGECSMDGGAADEENDNSKSGESSVDGGVADKEVEDARSGDCSTDGGADNEEYENAMSSESSTDGGASKQEVEYARSNICLEELEIDDWPNMELPLHQRYNFLRRVSIGSCNTLKSFPLDSFPSLQDLDLHDCSNLEKISVSDGHDQNPTSLTGLEIRDCPKFVSFPRVQLSKLEWCSIDGLDNFKALPENMATFLPSLWSLRIIRCPQLESFPEGSLPSNLKHLGIRNCPKVFASRMKWGLDDHKSLLTMSIEDADIQSFPDQGLLPPTLTSLHLCSCSNLKKLDYKGLFHLSNLKEMILKDCPKVQCMPEGGLPSSLYSLEISNCSLLKERCQKEKGQDWAKVARIPCIMIDDDIIT